MNDKDQYFVTVDPSWYRNLSGLQYTYTTGIDFGQNQTKKSTMKKLSNEVKKFLNVDLQAQLKAGYRNGDLELTQEGKDVLLELLVDTVADKFTASATEKIAEEEKKVA